MDYYIHHLLIFFITFIIFNKSYDVQLQYMLTQITVFI